MTANDPAFQPGFEQADTSVAGIVGLYGYYGGIASRESLPSSPFDYAERGSAPLILVHGEQDTFTSPARALALAQRARQASHNPVVYVELPAIMQAEAARGIPAGLDARRSVAEVLASQQA